MRFTMHSAPLFRVIVCLILCVLLAACGRKASLRPPDEASAWATPETPAGLHQDGVS